MNSRLLRDIRQAVAREAARRALKVYFEGKGFENPDALVMPSQIADISNGVPEFGDRLEVCAYNERYDPFTSVLKAGWNLYVNGSNRMFLGHTVHNRVPDLVSGTIPEHADLAEPEHTVKEICSFIMKVLTRSEDGFDRLPPNTRMSMPNPMGMRSMTGSDGSMTRSFINLP
jgi:hypothetical protein